MTLKRKGGTLGISVDPNNHQITNVVEGGAGDTAGRRLAVDLGDEVAHAKTGGVASASLDHVGNLVVVGVDRDSKRLSVTVRARFFAPEEPPASSSAVLRARLRWGAESAAGVISLSASSNFQPAC